MTEPASRLPSPGQLSRLLAERPPRRVHHPERKLAAVAVVLAPDPDSVLLIRRAVREGDRWSGQMAFPGGRWSPGDADLVTTARRETAEEVGLALDAAPLLGSLDDIASRTPVLPPIIVTPYVFLADRRRDLVLNREVSAARWVALAELLEPGRYRPFDYETRGARLRVPGYHLEEGVVWGMTERILTPFLGLLSLAPPRPTSILPDLPPD